jgi:Amt family ammonium transporter
MWDVTSLAVQSIVDWLRTGSEAGADERSRIAALGAAVAAQHDVTAPTGPIIGADPADRSSPPNQATAQMSVVLLTKLNLWWSDATCAVLTEEAERLGLSRATLDAATSMVVQSCHSSLVRMGKQYDIALTSLHEQLTHLALHDSLTGLSNRSVFLDRLDRALVRLARHPVGLAVVFMDLDNFKDINDAHGHGCGDQVLIEMATRMTAQVRPEDLVARLGGDEFVALFEDLSSPMQDAQTVAERIRTALSKPMMLNGEQLAVTVSIGIAVVEDPACKSDEVMVQADTAMYMVKRSGRNHVAAVEVGNGRQPIRFAGASGLHQALERKEFRLVYQPIHAVADQVVVGFEALLRWEHPERGTIPPLEFIPVAEESGLMVPIGEWVLEEACRQATEWRQTYGITAQMSVNVSGRQLADPSFVTHVATVLSATGMRPEHLILEITESILLSKGSGGEAVLAELKALGVRLSIDDFGTGYSSLAYLRRLTVDQLKVDRNFVQDMVGHGDTRIMEAVVRLAHDLGLEVVAEGVETTDELDAVRALGCDIVQGFLLGRPVPPARIAQTFGTGR